MSTQNYEFPILLLGPESCGKSLLLKSLQYYYSHDGKTWDFGSIPRHGRPTVGVDLVHFTLPVIFGDAKKRTTVTKKQNAVSIVLRELGGQMAPLWPTYFDDAQCRSLIYCVDALNPFQASRAAVELARILKNPKLRDTGRNILIIFTKSADLETDSSNCDSQMSVIELRNMMLMDDILDESRPFFKSVDIITKCSALKGVGLSDIFAWMERTARN